MNIKKYTFDYLDYFKCTIPIINETENGYCIDRIQSKINELNPCWIGKSQTIKKDGLYIRYWLVKDLTFAQKMYLINNE